MLYYFILCYIILFVVYIIIYVPRMWPRTTRQQSCATPDPLMRLSLPRYPLWSPVCLCTPSPRAPEECASTRPLNAPLPPRHPSVHLQAQGMYRTSPKTRPYAPLCAPHMPQECSVPVHSPCVPPCIPLCSSIVRPPPTPAQCATLRG